MDLQLRQGVGGCGHARGGLTSIVHAMLMDSASGGIGYRATCGVWARMRHTGAWAWAPTHHGQLEQLKSKHSCCDAMSLFEIIQQDNHDYNWRLFLPNRA